MNPASYTAKLRRALGHEKIIVPGVNAITSPKYDIVYPNGDILQNFVAVFHVAEWSGEIRAGAETRRRHFFNPMQTPAMVSWHAEILEDFARWDGRVIVK